MGEELKKLQENITGLQGMSSDSSGQSGSR